MAVVSGTVLHYSTNLPVSGIPVALIFTGSGTVHASGTSDSGGQFSITHSGWNEFLLTPVSSGWRGYGRVFPKEASQVNLFVRPDTNTVTSVSGRFCLNMIAPAVRTGSNIKDIVMSPMHAFVVTEGGLDIVALDTFKNIAYYRNPELTCVDIDKFQVDGFNIYLGSTNSGILVTPFSGTVAGNIASAIEQPIALTLNSSSILDLSCNSLGEILAVTSSGIAFINLEESKYYHNFEGGVSCCHLSEAGDIYYSPAGSGLYAQISPISGDWDAPAYMLSTDGGILQSNRINCITTSVSGDVTQVFLGTTSGITLYAEEDAANISGSAFSYLDLGTPIGGPTEDIKSIWLSDGATVASGTLYFAAQQSDGNGIVQSVNLETKTVISSFTSAALESALYRTNVPVSGASFVGVI